jgi:hypothetical protein
MGVFICCECCLLSGRAECCVLSGRAECCVLSGRAEGCVLSGRGLCDEQITRLEELYLVLCVKLNVIKEHHGGGLDPLGLSSHEKKTGTTCKLLI